MEREKEKLRGKLQSVNLSKGKGKRLAKLRAIGYLRLVRLPEPERVFKMYPFELSGGMRQRAMIAKMALVRRPKLLLADEIITALEVTVQAQILELLKDLRDKIDSSIILITHDLSVIDIPKGCRFRTRCPYATAKCTEEFPPLIEIEPGHWVECHYDIDFKSTNNPLKSQVSP